MNQRYSVERGRLQLRLGLLQAVLLVGFTGGCLVASFFLGFSSGHAVGYEIAADGLRASQPRIPVSIPKESGDWETEVLDRVSAKLKETSQLLPGDAQFLPGGAQGGHAAQPTPLAVLNPQEGLAVMVNESVPEEVVPAGSKATKPEELAALPKGPAVGLPKGSDKGNSAGSLVAQLAGADAPPAPGMGREPRAGDLPTGMAPDGEEKLPAGVRVIRGTAAADPSRAGPGTLASLRDNDDRERAKGAQNTTQLAAAGVMARPAPTVAFKAPTPATTTRSTAIGSGWYAQVAAPGTRQDATQLASKLRSSGFPVIVEEATVRGQSYFRVLVGPEGDKTRASRLVSQLEREKYLKGKPFLKFVK